MSIEKHTMRIQYLMDYYKRPLELEKVCSQVRENTFLKFTPGSTRDKK